MLTADEFTEIIKLVCPMCRAGRLAAVREDNGEFVHTETGGGVRFQQQLCWASNFRRSRFAPRGET